MDKNLRIAVLGATGKLGSHFVKQSLDKGFSLRVLVRNKSIFEYKNNSDVSIVVGNSTRALKSFCQFAIDNLKIIIVGS